ncbi:hypothetical protein K1719_022572 [Acacia pycnantha]|nr:hypothetical protein K1719_022572 [Acacia pycnantha]
MLSWRRGPEAVEIKQKNKSWKQVKRSVSFSSFSIDLLLDFHFQVSFFLCNYYYLIENESERQKWNERKSTNIVVNHDFSGGLYSWYSNCRHGYVVSGSQGRILIDSDRNYAVVTNRHKWWQGLEQNITTKISVGSTYKVSARVGVSGLPQAFRYLFLVRWEDFSSRGQLGKVRRVILLGKYLISSEGGSAGDENVATDPKFDDGLNNWSGRGCKIALHSSLEGPPPGTDILVNTLCVKRAAKAPLSSPPDVIRLDIDNAAFGINVIENTNLDDGTKGWFVLGDCTLKVGTGSPRMIPPWARDSLGAHQQLSGRYVLVTNRTKPWMDPAQIITEKLKLLLTYQWVNGGHVEVADDRWYEVGGSFRIEKPPSKVMVHIQGPASGLDVAHKLACGAFHGTVQRRIKALSKDDVMKAVQNRSTRLLSRYKGKFKHYDVNNENDSWFML